MSDEAIGWDDFGGEEQESKLLPPSEYAGTITDASWVFEPWAERTFPGSGGRLCKVKVEIDAASGYATVITKIPAVKERRWQFRVVCAAAGVPAPSKEGAPWSPASLVGKRVQLITKIYTNPKTDESKVEVEKWLPAAAWTQSDAVVETATAKPPMVERAVAPQASSARPRPADDDIPF